MNRTLAGAGRIALTVAVIAGLGVGASSAPRPAVGSGTADRVSGDVVGLVSFDSCHTALKNLRRAARPFVTPYGFAGAGRMMDGVAGRLLGFDAEASAARRDGADHSATNIHESGVDEPDLAKTDGRRLVTVADGALRVIDVATRTVTSRLPVRRGADARLLLHEDRALVMSRHPRAWLAMDGLVEPDRAAPRADLALIDLQRGARELGRLSVDAEVVDARLVGSVARVVVRSAPRLGFVTPSSRTSPAAALRHNRAVLERSTIDDWVPGFTLRVNGERHAGQLVDCGSISHPADYSGVSMLNVLTIDLSRDLGTGNPVAIVADGGTVYGTGQSLYVAHDRREWTHPGPWAGRRFPPSGPVNSTASTEIYQFALPPLGKPTFVASGVVDGTLLDQYALSEHGGYLRVATTTEERARSRSRSQSMITVLARQGERLMRVGRVAGLGVGERIYSVRFQGEIAHVVTFRRIDPLYSLDLSDPRRPRVTGKLKIPGYSSYLHPVGDDRLIGVGRGVVEGRPMSSTQVSVFDVSDPSSPRRTHVHHERGTVALVEQDPHAFLFWEPRGILVLPTYAYGWDRRQRHPGAGALVLELSGDELSEVGYVTHPRVRGAVPGVTRAFVINDELWTVGGGGVLVSDLDALSRVGWIRFT